MPWGVRKKVPGGLTCPGGFGKRYREDLHGGLTGSRIIYVLEARSRMSKKTKTEEISGIGFGCPGEDRRWFSDDKPASLSLLKTGTALQPTEVYEAMAPEASRVRGIILDHCGGKDDFKASLANAVVRSAAMTPIRDGSKEALSIFGCFLQRYLKVSMSFEDGVQYTYITEKGNRVERSTDYSIVQADPIGEKVYVVDLDLKSSLHGLRNEKKAFNVEVRRHLFNKAILVVGVLANPKPIIIGEVPRMDLWACCGVGIAHPALMTPSNNSDSKHKFSKLGLAAIQWIIGDGVTGSRSSLVRLASIPDRMVHDFVEGRFMEEVIFA